MFYPRLPDLTGQYIEFSGWGACSHQLCSSSTPCKHVMEPAGSLPHSQEPSTGACPVPDQSNPHHPILCL
jgi:hypothetical protein